MAGIDDMEIAPRFMVADWKKLNLSDPKNNDWQKAISIFERRIHSRFVEPANILISVHRNDSSKKVGFAVLILDFIVIETLQGFRDGELHRDNPGELFKKFLTTAIEFANHVPTEAFAGFIYSVFRSSISHQGQTGGNFRVVASGDMIERRGWNDVRINRTKFHDAVKKALDRYCSELRDFSNTSLRNNFKKKMDYICGLQTTNS